MSVYDTVRSRLTVREFTDDPVPDEVVEKLLRAAQWAPEFAQPPALAFRRNQGQRHPGPDCKRSLQRTASSPTPPWPSP